MPCVKTYVPIIGVDERVGQFGILIVSENSTGWWGESRYARNLALDLLRNQSRSPSAFVWREGSYVWEVE